MELCNINYHQPECDVGLGRPAARPSVRRKPRLWSHKFTDVTNALTDGLLDIHVLVF